MSRSRARSLAAPLAILLAGAPAAAQVSRVTTAPNGASGDRDSYNMRVTPDGRYLVFDSYATNLVAADTNGQRDVFLWDRATVTLSRLSVNSAGAQANGGESSDPDVSADGRYVVFVSAATNVVSNDTNVATDVFVRDRATGTTTRVSVATGGVQANGSSDFPCISADGRYVAFLSAATNLVTGDTNGQQDVFLHDRASGTTTRVNLGPGGVQAAGGTSRTVAGGLSADGRHLAYWSDATNLVAGDTNARSDVFVYDRQTSTTARVSVATGGTQGDLGSLNGQLSLDGRYVVFQSSASTLVAGDTNGVADIFVHDRQTATTARVNVGTGGVEAAGFGSANESISGDGRFVMFTTFASNLVTGDTNGATDAFVHDRQSGVTRRVSVDNDGVQANGACGFATALSGDGRYAYFANSGAFLPIPDTPSTYDIFQIDMRAFQRSRVSVSTAGAEGNQQSLYPALSRDGRYVAFMSLADNLVPGDTNGVADVFVRDRATGTTERVSLAPGGVQANGDSGGPAISADGRYVAFASLASNLVPGDTNGMVDVFVADRDTHQTTRVSVSSAGVQGDAPTDCPIAMSGDGRYVAFCSPSSLLVSGDTNNASDVFVHDRLAVTTTRVSVATGGVQALGGGLRGGRLAMTPDARYVAFSTGATNLVTGDTNGREDVFVHDRETGITTRVSVSSAGAQAVSGDSGAPSITDDGRYVAFHSEAANLVNGDLNHQQDIFVRDRAANTTRRVNVGPSGEANEWSELAGSQSFSGDGRFLVFNSFASNIVSGDTNAVEDVFVVDQSTRLFTRVSAGEWFTQGDADGIFPTISPDGRVVAWSSQATTLVPSDTNGVSDVFIRALSPELYGIIPRSGPTNGGTTTFIDGAGVAEGTTVRFGHVDAAAVAVASPGRVVASTPANAAGPAHVRVRVPGYAPEYLPFGFVYFTPGAAADTDGDGMPDATEILYSLDALNPSDAAADDDNDGLSNEAEVAAGSHPHGRVTRYLAEGATGSFFDTTLALVNPGDVPATALLRYQTSTGATIPHLLTVAPHSRTSIDAGAVPGLASAEFSTVFESDAPVTLDRLMTWDGTGYGSHLETASELVSETWYLAEGATHSGFDLFYLLQNPQDTTTTATVTFLRPAPLAPIVRVYSLAPRSRTNIWVNLVDPVLAATDVSASIVASNHIIVERAMYKSGARPFDAGHESMGVPFPQLTWLFAEGATGACFDLFILLANPDTQPAQAEVTFLLPGGGSVVKTYTIAPQSRSNIWVDLVDPALADTAVSTIVRVTNGVPIVAERAMWWPGQPTTWREAHNSPGAASAGVDWIASAGEDGGAYNAETYLLVANTATYSATARVTLFLDDGTTMAKEFTVTPASRFNVAVRTEFPSAAGHRFGARVESVGLGAAPLVVEQALYADAGGMHWASGADALATRVR